MEKFKLHDRVVFTNGRFNGKTATIAGIDNDTTSMPYIVAIDGVLDVKFLVRINEFSTLENASELSTRKELLNKYGMWSCGDNIKSLEEEKAEILKAANTPVYVRRFQSGAVRSDDRGREKPSFVSPYAIKFVAEHFSANSAFFNDKDSAKNYMKGIKPEDIEDSLERHMLDFKFAMMPQNTDRSKVKKTLTEIMANCVMALHQIGLEEDGLYKEIYPSVEYIEKEYK